jgi:hypothetical protein
MSTTAPTDLASWSAFEAANTRLANYVKSGTMHGFTIYAPPQGQPGIQVLTAPSGSIAGFAVAEPASWGWYPGYFPGPRRPMTSALYKTAYESVLLLQPVPATGGTTTGAARGKAGVRMTPKPLVRSRPGATTGRTGTKTGPNGRGTHKGAGTKAGTRAQGGKHKGTGGAKHGGTKGGRKG